jgi:hypothetical protein
MMPLSGQYQCQEIEEQAFVSHLVAYWRQGIVVSYIGYPTNQAYIREISGINVPINRGPTELEPGDIMLCMRVLYEQQDQQRKQPSDGSRRWEFREGPRRWQFFLVRYQTL